MEFHHGKHHLKYVVTANDLIKGTELEGADIVRCSSYLINQKLFLRKLSLLVCLCSIIRKSFGTNQALFNNAAQSFNHDFYWLSIKPGGGGATFLSCCFITFFLNNGIFYSGKPTGKLAEAIDKDFGSYENFRKELVNKAMTAFGSGWAWLVHTPSGLKASKL